MGIDARAMAWVASVEGFIIEEDSAPLALAFLHLRSAFTVAPVEAGCVGYFVDALEAFRDAQPEGSEALAAVEVHIRAARSFLRELRRDRLLAMVREYELARFARDGVLTGVFMWEGKPAGFGPMAWPKGLEVPEGSRALMIAENSDEAPVFVLVHADGSLTARDGARSVWLRNMIARETAPESGRFDVFAVGGDTPFARDVAERELSRWR